MIPPEDLGPAMQLMAVEGVMARRVADVRLGLAIVGGLLAARPASRCPCRSTCRAAESRRVALVAEPPGGDTHPEIAAAVRRAGDALADAGYDVVEAEPPAYEQALRRLGPLAVHRHPRPGGAAARGHGRRTRCGSSTSSARSTRRSTPPALVAALVERRAIPARGRQFLLEHPLILSPIWTQPPFPHGWDVESEANAHGDDAADAPGHAGEPARAPGRRRARPARAAGLPVGVQVMGERFQELACLEAAEAIEAALGVATPIDPVLEGAPAG